MAKPADGNSTPPPDAKQRALRETLVKARHLKIISWNCCMKFRDKAQIILEHNPDILVIQECEAFERIDFNKFSKLPTSMHWTQYESGNKGLGIFSFGNFSFKVQENYSSEFSVIVPVRVSDGTEDINLYGVWTVNTRKPGGSYIDQIWNAVEFYDPHIRSEKTMLIGDFNSNVIFDKKNRQATHQNLVTRLAEKGIKSVYHSKFNQTQGLEQEPTFYLYRHQDKPFHIDHCFASEDLLNRIDSLKIGKYEDWKAYSDHTPMILTLN